MEVGDAIVVDDLASVETPPSRPVIYDRDIGMRLIYEDPVSGEEHYLIRYPAGLRARRHRHTAAQTIVVLEGHLSVNGTDVGPGAYCHFPPGQPMLHEPMEGEPCVFVSIFHGPADVEPLDDD